MKLWFTRESRGKGRQETRERWSPAERWWAFRSEVGARDRAWCPRDSGNPRRLPGQERPIKLDPLLPLTRIAAGMETGHNQRASDRIRKKSA